MRISSVSLCTRKARLSPIDSPKQCWPLIYLCPLYPPTVIIISVEILSSLFLWPSTEAGSFYSDWWPSPSFSPAHHSLLNNRNIQPLFAGYRYQEYYYVISLVQSLWSHVDRLGEVEFPWHCWHHEHPHMPRSADSLCRRDLHPQPRAEQCYL